MQTIHEADRRTGQEHQTILEMKAHQTKRELAVSHEEKRARSKIK